MEMIVVSRCAPWYARKFAAHGIEFLPVQTGLECSAHKGDRSRYALPEGSRARSKANPFHSMINVRCSARPQARFPLLQGDGMALS